MQGQEQAAEMTTKHVSLATSRPSRALPPPIYPVAYIYSIIIPLFHHVPVCKYYILFMYLT